MISLSDSQIVGDKRDIRIQIAPCSCASPLLTKELFGFPPINALTSNVPVVPERDMVLQGRRGYF